MISLLVQLELTYLHELKELVPSADVVLDTVAGPLGCQSANASFASVVRHAAPLTWTRDTFDRLRYAHR